MTASRPAVAPAYDWHLPERGASAWPVPRFRKATHASRFWQCSLPALAMTRLCPEDLRKPNKTFTQLIHEALSSRAGQSMILTEIYDYIMDRYPYFAHGGKLWKVGRQAAGASPGGRAVRGAHVMRG